MSQFLSSIVAKFLRQSSHRNLNGLAEYVTLSRAYIALLGIQAHCAEATARYYESSKLPGIVPPGMGSDYLHYRWHGVMFVLSCVKRAMDTALGDAAQPNDFDAALRYIRETYGTLKAALRRFEDHSEYEQTAGMTGTPDEEAATGSLYINRDLGALTYEECMGAAHIINTALISLAQSFGIAPEEIF